MKKKKIIILIVIAALVVIVPVAVYTIKAALWNIRVDFVAEEYIELMDEVTIKPNDEISEGVMIGNTKVMEYVLVDGKLKEDILTYYNGSKSKYNELDAKLNELKEIYKKYLYNANYTLLGDNPTGLNNASPETLKELVTVLEKYKSEVDEWKDSPAWDEDIAWVLIWGDNKDEALKRYIQLGKELDVMLSRIKNQLFATVI